MRKRTIQSPWLYLIDPPPVDGIYYGPPDHRPWVFAKLLESLFRGDRIDGYDGRLLDFPNIRLVVTTSRPKQPKHSVTMTVTARWPLDRRWWLALLRVRDYSPIKSRSLLGLAPQYDPFGCGVKKYLLANGFKTRRKFYVTFELSTVQHTRHIMPPARKCPTRNPRKDPPCPPTPRPEDPTLNPAPAH